MWLGVGMGALFLRTSPGDRDKRVLLGHSRKMTEIHTLSFKSLVASWSLPKNSMSISTSFFFFPEKCHAMNYGVPTMCYALFQILI